MNDLGIIFTNKLKWDSHISQRLMTAQQKRNVVPSSAYLLEEKRSLFCKYENKSKFVQKLHFISSPLRVKCSVLELAKLHKTGKDAKTSAQVGFE